MKQYFITSEEVKAAVIVAISTIEATGKVEVIIRKAGTKSYRQRGWQWAMFSAIEKSGMGGHMEETKKDVSVKCKYLFGRVYQAAITPWFIDNYRHFLKTGPSNEEHYAYIDYEIRTEKFSVDMMTDYLTEIYNYYTRRGFAVPHPDVYHLELGDMK